MKVEVSCEMQRQCAVKEEPNPHLSFLRLLTSPLRLLCATIWHIVQERDVLNYGMLEEFVTVITETVPELLNHRQRAQLIFGLRAKVILELCRSESFSNAHTIQHHLDRIRIPAAVLAESSTRDKDVEKSQSNFLALVDILLNDPIERDNFFQEVFPVVYGPKYDLALERLIWTFVSRLEEVLPVPSIYEVASLLSVSPSVINECFHALLQPQELLNSLNHHKTHTLAEIKAISPVAVSVDDDCIFSCLSHPPLVQTMVDAECKASEIGLESEVCEEVPIECEEVSSLDAEVDTDDVQPEAVRMSTDSGAKELAKFTDYQRANASLDGERPNDDVCKEPDMDSQTAEDEQEEPPSSKEAIISQVSCFISEDGTVGYTNRVPVKDSPEGSGSGTEAQPEEMLSRSEHCYSRTVSVHSTSEDALSCLCLQRQPTVRLERIDISGKPLPQPPPRQSGRVRKKKILMLWRKNRGPEIAWLIEPPKTAQSDMKPKTESGSNKKSAAMVFACSKCSFHDVTETNLHQHLMKNHPDEFSRLLSAGIRQTVGPKPIGNQTTDASVRQKPPRRRGPVPKTCPLCAKTFTRGTDMRRHLKSHSGERLHCCLGCGRCFLHVHHLKRHTVACKEVIASHPNQDSQLGEGISADSTGPNEEIGTKVLVSSKDDLQDSKDVTQDTEMPTASTVQAENETPDPRLCPMCGVFLARASDMERHMRSHSVEKPYECMHCSKMYRYPYNLKKHIDLCHSELNAPGSQNHEDVQPSNDGRTLLPGDTRSKVCPSCGKTFTRAADMRRHQRCHAAHRFECSKCGEGFRYPLDLKQHEQNCTKPAAQPQELVSAKSPLTCSTCGKTFSFLTHLKRHMRAHRQAGKPTKRWHKCSKCEEIFRTLYDLGKHQRCHWSDDPLRCTQCGRRFSNSGQLASHKQIHSLVCTMKCTMCEETFTELGSFRWHYLEAHNVRGAYPCSHCEKSFTELCPLVRHVRTHTGERPFLCQQCPRSFSSPTKLWLHRRVHGEQTGRERERERRHLCHECGKRFYTLVELTRHEVVHCEERPHMCAHCGKAFKRQRSLTAHMESHLEKEARVGYPCAYCGKSFMKPGALVRHNRIHTGERPHRCSECNKSFLTHSEVLKHMRFHTGERPFKCEVCGKGFTQSCYLTVHMRSHTGERPYACKVCDKRFSDSAHRNRHMLIHTGEKPHVCERCGKAFNRKHLLNVHLKTCV